MKWEHLVLLAELERPSQVSALVCEPLDVRQEPGIRETVLDPVRVVTDPIRGGVPRLELWPRFTPQLEVELGELGRLTRPSLSRSASTASPSLDCYQQGAREVRQARPAVHSRSLVRHAALEVASNAGQRLPVDGGSGDPPSAASSMDVASS